MPLRHEQIHANRCLSTACRLCVKQCNIGELSPIFSDASESLIEEIVRVLQIQPCSGDGLPASICKLCIEMLTLSSQFISSSEATDDLLRKVITFISEASSLDSQMHDITEEIFMVFELINGNGGMSSLCRLCAAQHKSHESKIFLAAVNNTYMKKIRRVLSAKPSEGDGLPDSICSSCASKLDAAHDFITVSVHGDSLLREAFHGALKVEDAFQLESHFENNVASQQETMEMDTGADFEVDAPPSPLFDPLASPSRSDSPNDLHTVAWQFESERRDLVSQHSELTSPGQSDEQSQPRGQDVVQPELVRRPWTKEEDDKVLELVGMFGFKNWTLIARLLKDRTRKQCRQRWHDCLDPNIKKTAWTSEEEAIIINAHHDWGNQWTKIAKLLPGRTRKQCRQRWHDCLDLNLKKTAWTGEEDAILVSAYQELGNQWTKIAELLPGRTGYKCRRHWHNCLDPNLKKTPWTGEEDAIIVNAYRELGNQWTKIAKLLPGRTTSSIKNRWRSEEDVKVFELVHKFGPKNWTLIAQHMEDRISQQCRKRWNYHLNTNHKKYTLTREEGAIIVNARHDWGNQWTKIAKLLPGRTGNAVKHHWHMGLRHRGEAHVQPEPAKRKRTIKVTDVRDSFSEDSEEPYPVAVSNTIQDAARIYESGLRPGLYRVNAAAAEQSPSFQQVPLALQVTEAEVHVEHEPVFEPNDLQREQQGEELQTTRGTSPFHAKIFASDYSSTDYPAENSETHLISPEQLKTNSKQSATSYMHLDTGDHSYARTDSWSITPCNVCKVEFDSKLLLQTHMQTHAVEFPFSCTLCHQAFKTKEELKGHVFYYVHTEVAGAYVCDICQRPCMSIQRLAIHMLKYPQALCLEEFAQDANLSQQVAHEHHETSPAVVCDAVDKQCSTESDLTHVQSLASVDSEPVRGHVCHKCGAKFNANSFLIAHMRLHTRKQSFFSCPDCDKIFLKKTNLTRHALQEHPVPVPAHVCDKCGKQFSTKYGVARHKRLHLGGQSIECPDCYKIFPLKSRLHAHAALKHNACKKCGKKFKGKASLKKHMQLHAHGESFACQDCDKIFTSKTSLARHSLQEHAVPVQNHVCDKCGAKFSAISSLIVHMRLIHTLKHLFVCPCCDKIFTRKTCLTRHALQEHSLPGPGHVCDKCGKQFRTKYYLAYHERLHLDCNKIFPQKSHLLARATLKHSGPLPNNACDKCGKEFRSKGNLTSHMRLHARGQSFACPNCDKIFTRETYLARHALQEHSVPLPRNVCDKCGKQFRTKITLDAHMQLHLDIGGGSNECPDCFMIFPTKSGLTTHAARKHPDAELDYVSDESDEWWLIQKGSAAHKRSHLRGQTFKCQDCYKIFPLKSQLLAHAALEHSDPLPDNIRDEICTGKAYLTRHALQKHSVSVPGHVCDECGKHFGTKITLANHKRLQLHGKSI